MTAKPKIFVSYARPDVQFAQSLTEELKRLGIEVWIDYDRLAFGEDFAEAIVDGLKSSNGVLVIASARSIKSNWVAAEMQFAARGNVPLLPVVLESFNFLPKGLEHIQAVCIPKPESKPAIAKAALEIAQWARRISAEKTLGDDFSQHLASNLAREAHGAGQQLSEKASSSAFIVHGHDEVALQGVCDVLQSIGVRPVVLKEVDGGEDWLLKRFLQTAEEASFAIILLSPDDFGASVLEYEAPKGGERALQYRARQNVILELGFFLGKLKDFNRVSVLRCPPKEPMPRFEGPSDLAGKMFNDLDREGRWKVRLLNALE